MMIYGLPYIFSFVTGWLLIKTMSGKKPTGGLTGFFLGAGLGLGISALILFSSYLLFDTLNRPYMFAVHLAVLAACVIIQTFRRSGKEPGDLLVSPWQDAAIILAVALLAIPLWTYANCYPHGGWDAWQVWNFKAKTLLLSGEGQWRSLFDPGLWRTSPHYPLLLPLINVWGWSWTGTVSSITPLLTSILFTLLTAGLLASGIKDLSGSKSGALAPLLLFSVPYCELLAISQYCDIILSFYLLAAVIGLAYAVKRGNPSHALLAGLNLGLLSFTKPEGTVAAVVLTGLGAGYILLNGGGKPKGRQAAFLKSLLIGCVIGTIPSVIFQFFLSPGNQTFSNGFTSAVKPADGERFKIVISYFFKELTTAKWNGLWFVLLGGVIVSRGKCFRPQLLIMPAFLLSYLTVIIIYYVMNTHFEITWWLDVSLSRILFSLLPVFALWVFSGILEK